MFVREALWEEIIAFFHLLSSNKATCVFTFRIVDGRVTRGTVREAQKWVRKLGISNGIYPQKQAQEKEPTHAQD